MSELMQLIMIVSIIVLFFICIISMNEIWILKSKINMIKEELGNVYETTDRYVDIDTAYVCKDVITDNEYMGNKLVKIRSIVYEG